MLSMSSCPALYLEWFLTSGTVGCYALMIIVPIAQYLWYKHENHRRDEKLAREGGGADEVLRTEFTDKTDFERWQTFRYTL